MTRCLTCAPRIVNGTRGSRLRRERTLVQTLRSDLPSFISTVRVRNSSLPTFSRECGVSGAPHTAVPRIGVDFKILVSASTFPSGSRRTKSLLARMYRTPPHRWVCTGTVAPDGTRPSRTLTRSSSNRTVWKSGAAIMASRSSGHGHAAGVPAPVNGMKPFALTSSFDDTPKASRCHHASLTAVPSQFVHVQAWSREPPGSPPVRLRYADALRIRWW
jgi:hypothetical protein